MGNQDDWLKNGCNQIFVAQISYQGRCTDIPHVSFIVIFQINCAVYCNTAHVRVVQIRLIYGCTSDYGHSQIVIAWLCMIPAVDHVLCNRRAIGAYGNNVSCLSAGIPGAHNVKLDQWPVIFFPDCHHCMALLWNPPRPCHHCTCDGCIRVAQHHELQCPRHTMFLVLEGVRPCLIQPRPFSMRRLCYLVSARKC